MYQSEILDGTYSSIVRQSVSTRALFNSDYSESSMLNELMSFILNTLDCSSVISFSTYIRALNKRSYPDGYLFKHYEKDVVPFERSKYKFKTRSIDSLRFGKTIDFSDPPLISDDFEIPQVHIDALRRAADRRRRRSSISDLSHLTFSSEPTGIEATPINNARDEE